MFEVCLDVTRHRPMNATVIYPSLVLRLDLRRLGRLGMRATCRSSPCEAHFYNCVDADRLDVYRAWTCSLFSVDVRVRAFVRAFERTYFIWSMLIF